MALRGRHLRVGADTWIPWVDVHEHEDGSLSASGVAAAFFDIIATKLNFSYTLMVPADREWGRGMPNGSFTGMIGMCQRKEVDVAIGPFGITYERAKVVDYSIPLFMDQFGIFLPRPRLEKDLAGISKPFAWQVWVVLAVAVLLCMIISLLMNHILKQRVTDVRGSRTPGAKSSVKPMWILVALFRGSIQTEPETGTERIFLATWMWAGLILSTAYCGVLTSLLAVPKVSVPVDSLQDLVAYKKIPWAIERGTFLHQVFAEATSGVYKMINDGGSLVTNGYDERDHIKTERIAVLCDVFTMKKIMSDDYSATGVCNYYIAEKPITSVALAFAFPKGSDLVQHFDRWLGPLKESGLVGRSVASLTANATACLVKPGKEGVKVSLVISLQDLAGLFILTGAGMLLGFIFLVSEWLTGVFKSPSVN